ncbi:ABC transporter substrate-binding protein [Saccharopolyspora sp. ASAGF58]|uniref:ABC transporter substrate-binding protein n=1 Tax=Saccharopolyspora sp. ASAGF58 TaxID=2719023 RepID=UPI00144007D1|nr:ABC transporter substrate-binding protein [Saccharopolyspora sp. ASAGF58]QIZ33537.1 ABC transporter substrate-binding protein [Saccharopolyspora sp. ASAGF58]
MDSYVERSWWQRNRRKVLVASVVLVLVAGGVVGLAWWGGQCAAGVHEVDGECVGMTDGSYKFGSDDPAENPLADVLQRIKEENDRVLAEGKDYVSIAYLAPMSLAEGDTVTLEATRNALRGAHLAQLRANREKGGWEGDFPLIRLLPTNPGSQLQKWDPVVKQIHAAQFTPDRVVAVAGLGQSHESTAKAIQWLSEQRIPMVGATITADTFTDLEARGEFSGLVRVSPTNTEQVRAIVQRLSGTRKAMLVKDINQSDLLANNLSSAFTREYERDGRDVVLAEYDTSRGTANIFPGMVRNICAAQPGAIFFSGRYNDLTLLLGALKNRPCGDLNLRVVTLDSVVDIAGVDEVRKNLSLNTILEYTNLSAPQAWNAVPEAFDGAATGYFRDSYRELFGLGSTGDGMAITSYDAVGVAVTAINRAADNRRDLKSITADTVAGQLLAMRGTEGVRGASGCISFDSVGHPVDKAISVFRLSIDDTSSSAEIVPAVVSGSGNVLPGRCKT